MQPRTVCAKSKTSAAMLRPEEEARVLTAAPTHGLFLPHRKERIRLLIGMEFVAVAEAAASPSQNAPIC
eukprot:m.44681 g.44681  ORF g.44681 m.44681 type:complete len:69 (+) comp8560_c0_seq2:9943-10149(+)